MTELEREIHERIAALSPKQQRAVLNHVRAQMGEPVPGTPGDALDRFFGIWTDEEADEIMRAIEEGCERVEPYGS
jgi:hypothetical protein